MKAIRPSKHSAKPMEGRVRITPESGLRKRMRAARRGLLPDEVLVTIEGAVESAARRWPYYTHAFHYSRYF